jgi:phosphatidylglycerophosphatase A
MNRWIVTFCGSGLSPVAPGTAGSLLATLLLCAIYWGTGEPVFGAWQIILVIGLGAFCAMSIGYGPWAIAHFGRKDPGPFVLDEAAGICLTNLLLPINHYPGWHAAWVFGLAFAAFRVFDVIKPPPARWLEQFPAGWGILLDDLAAAVYANIVCQIVLTLAWR